MKAATAIKDMVVEEDAVAEVADEMAVTEKAAADEAMEEEAETVE